MKKKCFSFRSFLRNKEGLSGIEWAFVMPILAVLLAGGYETGRFILIKQKTEKAAFAVGDAVSQGSLPAKDFTNAVRDLTTEIVRPFDPRRSSTVISVYQKEGSDIKLVSTTGGATRVNAGIIDNNFQLTDNQVIVATEVFYNYRPSLFTSVMTPKTFYKVSYFRPRRDSVALNAVSPEITVRTGALTAGSTYENLVSSRPGSASSSPGSGTSTTNSSTSLTDNDVKGSKGQFNSNPQEETDGTGRNAGTESTPNGQTDTSDKVFSKGTTGEKGGSPTPPVFGGNFNNTENGPLSGIYNGSGNPGGGSGGGSGGGLGAGPRYNGPPLTNDPNPHPWVYIDPYTQQLVTVMIKPVASTSTNNSSNPGNPTSNNNNNVSIQPSDRVRIDPTRVRDPRGTVKTATPRRFLDPKDPNYRPSTPNKQKYDHSKSPSNNNSSVPRADTGSGTSTSATKDNTSKSYDTRGYVPPQ